MTSPTRKRAVNDDRLDDNDVALLEAVERGDIDSVCRLVKAGARLDVAYDKGKTPLHVAVSAKAVHRGEGALGAKMLRFLCENGADINAVDKAGWTPLHDAFFLLVASAIFELSHASLRASLVAPSDTGRIPYTPIRLGVRVLDTLIDLGADTRCFPSDPLFGMVMFGVPLATTGCLFFLLCVVPAVFAQLPLVQHNALMKLYNSTACTDPNGCPRFASNEPCRPSTNQYSYLRCTADGVTHITIYGGGLQGTLPTEIGFLTALNTFEIEGNGVCGTLPTQIGMLTKLARLSLFSNRISGSMPTEIGSLLELQRLKLLNNQFSGNLPSEFDKLSALTECSGDIRARELLVNDTSETNCFTHCPQTCCVSRPTCTILPPTPSTTPTSTPVTTSTAPTNTTVPFASLTSSFLPSAVSMPSLAATTPDNSGALVGGIVAVVVLGVLVVLGSLYVAYRYRNSHRRTDDSKRAAAEPSATIVPAVAPTSAPSAASRHQYVSTLAIAPSTRVPYGALTASEI